MIRSFDALRVLLGLPVYRSVVGDETGGARVSAHWSCGCVAAGASFERMNLKTCSSHRAGRVALPAVAV